MPTSFPPRQAVIPVLQAFKQALIFYSFLLRSLVSVARIKLARNDFSAHTHTDMHVHIDRQTILAPYPFPFSCHPFCFGSGAFACITIAGRERDLHQIRRRRRSWHTTVRACVSERACVLCVFYTVSSLFAVITGELFLCAVCDFSISPWNYFCRFFVHC